MITADRLRPPSPLDLRPEAYKDWLHVNVVLPSAGVVGLVNASLHGPLLSPASMTVGTAAFYHFEGGWHTHIEIGEQVRSDLDEGAVRLETVAVQLAVGDRVNARVEGEQVALDLAAEPGARPLEMDTPAPFGSGWIAWRAVPRMAPQGSLRLGSSCFDLDGGLAYHDHNWGRWFWGDDIGWEWGAFLPDEEGAIVFTRTTNRSHTRGSPRLQIETVGVTRSFASSTVTASLEGRLERPIPRIPGAMAALHTGRVRPRLPESVMIVADDGLDRVRVEFRPDHACQVIAAEPARPGASFIHELVGRFRADSTIERRHRHHEGLGVFEYVT